MPAGSLPVAAGKRALREELRRRRAELTAEERRAHSDAIARRLRTLPEARGTGAVLGYAATPAEVDLDGLLARWIAEGRSVWLPWVSGEHLGIARVRDLAAELSVGHRGIREPAHEGAAPADLGDMELVVVPGVGFSPDGARLGYGGGHFDRLLAGRHPHTALVGVAFERQVVPHLVQEPHDRRVDIVVTERRVLRPRPR